MVWARLSSVLAAFLLCAVLVMRADASAQSFAGTVTQYVDPGQQTKLSFGDRSHWLQPWRAYMDTFPATRLKDAVGIGFNVDAGEAEATARLLAASGFTRARIEVGWNSIDYDDPTQLADPAALRTKLAALKQYGIRPLILLIHTTELPVRCGSGVSSRWRMPPGTRAGCTWMPPRSTRLSRARPASIR